MRSTRPLIAVAALLTTFVGLAGAQALTATPAPQRGGTEPASYAYLRTQVFTAPGLGSVAVGMPNRSVVRIQHRPVGAATWDSPSVLFAGKGRVTCGEIDGAVSPGGIALTIECDRNYYADQAPVHTQALVTRDLSSWSRRELPGEAYQPPAISPTGGPPPGRQVGVTGSSAGARGRASARWSAPGSAATAAPRRSSRRTRARSA